MRPTSSRRQFLKSASAQAAALALTARGYARIAGANERISIGVVGCGKRGFGAHMPGVQAHAESQNIEITAVADPWQSHREAAAAKVKEWTGRPARMFVSYRDLLALDDIDAVMIASCDHQHTTHLEAVAKAKKDVYCEKPLAMELPRLRRACDAVRANNVVCQIGTQVRSWPTSRGCRELFQSGVLGKISRVEQCRNTRRPYWYTRLADVNPAEVDWDEFLMHRPKRPFSAELFTGWYGYRDFSAGPVPGYGSHFIDLMNFIVGTSLPASSVAQGGTFTWKDEHAFTCPDHVQATWIYPEGLMASYSSNFGNGDGNTFRIYGEKGVMDLTNWTKPMVYGKGAIKKGKLGKPVAVEPVEGPDHFLDWLRCLRTRETPNASIEAGYQHAVAVIMAMEAFDTGRRQMYDHKQREFRAA
jgi:predicted dehydrogenase